MALSHACSQQGRQDGVMKLFREAYADISDLCLIISVIGKVISPKSQMSVAIREEKECPFS